MRLPPNRSRSLQNILYPLIQNCELGKAPSIFVSASTKTLKTSSSINDFTSNNLKPATQCTFRYAILKLQVWRCKIALRSDLCTYSKRRFLHVTNVRSVNYRLYIVKNIRKRKLFLKLTTHSQKFRIARAQ